MTTATLTFPSALPAVTKRRARKAAPTARHGGRASAQPVFPWMTAQMQRNLHPRALRLLRADY